MGEFGPIALAAAVFAVIAPVGCPASRGPEVDSD